MSELLQLIIIVALWSWGIYNAFKPGQIFGVVGDWLRARVPEYWLKPVIGCMVCIPSVHGTALYLLFHNWQWDFTSWIVTIVCASGMNFVLKEMIYED